MPEWIGLLGVGTVMGALISATVLYQLEKKRQDREDKRTLLTLQRQDQRQWDAERREAFGRIQAQLQMLRKNRLLMKLNERELKYNKDEFQHEKHIRAGYQAVSDTRDAIVSVIGSIRLITDESTFEAFRDASRVADDTYDEFIYDNSARLTYIEDENIDINTVEDNLLNAVRLTMKTPDAF